MHLIDKRHLKVINYFASIKLEIRKLVARPCQKILIIFLAYCFANTGTWLSPAQGWFSGWFVFYVQVFYVRYGIIPSNTSSASQYGTSFSVDHAMPLWYVLLWDYLRSYTGNEVRDLTASLLAEVHHNVVTEPSLQPITSETFLLSMPTPIIMLIWILRPEISGVQPGCIFWCSGILPQCLHAVTTQSLSLTSAYKHHEDAKTQELLWSSS